MGVARLAGNAADPAIVTAAGVWRPWGGPAASATAFGAAGPFALTLAVEAGYSVIATRALAYASTVMSIEGWWLALSVGGAIRP
jgi:hypothetical protein